LDGILKKSLTQIGLSLSAKTKLNNVLYLYRNVAAY